MGTRGRRADTDARLAGVIAAVRATLPEDDLTLNRKQVEAHVAAEEAWARADGVRDGARQTLTACRAS